MIVPNVCRPYTIIITFLQDGTRDYANKISTFINNVKKDFGLPNLKFGLNLNGSSSYDKVTNVERKNNL